MSDQLHPSEFNAFYAALHNGREPFPWQRMLADRVAAEGWPEGIALPTASGKTAALDVAIFSLACQAERSPEERTTPRRVFYIVDRRIIVDAAHEHAAAMAAMLANAQTGILARVAERLRRLQGEEVSEPLYTARLRGGVVRDDGWAHSPAQAAIVCGTVDQIGSRLLFRGFGPGQLTAPIHAGLIANDSLLLLDEAHCAVPFLQTTRAVAAYRDSPTEQPFAPGPFRTTVMSATPPETIPPAGLFPTPDERDSALDHPALDMRLRTAKPAALAQCQAMPKNATPETDPLVHEAARRAVAAEREGAQRIAVMVNRVATARAVYRQLAAEREQQAEPEFDTELLTGRMRALDRDDVLEHWQPALRADDPQAPERPVILVTTQCLEVGADFSFDGLITECASLDALRQRFGRFNRLGNADTTQAVILIRSDQAKKSDDDPIYGAALAATWHWLKQQAEPGATKKADPKVDFGALALDDALAGDSEGRRERERALAAPKADAPVMLPAHLDALAQTAPRPTPDPDVSVFLHGPDSSAPEVQIAFRADLDVPDADSPNLNAWLDALSVVPPATGETMAVPLWLIKRILAQGEAKADIPDVEGAAALSAADRPDRTRSQRPIVIWRGRQDSQPTYDLKAIQPNDTVIIPIHDRGEQDGDSLVDGLMDRPVEAPRDRGDAAARAANRPPTLRVGSQTLAPWNTEPTIQALIEWARDPNRAETPGELAELLEAISEAEALPAWLRETASALTTNARVIDHPVSGYILVSARSTPSGTQDAGADADDLTSQAGQALTLNAHLAHVEAAGRRFGNACLTPELAQAIAVAAWLHDIGKADPRFQTMLHGGNEFARYRAPEALAKGATMPATKRARQRARELSRLPDRFRHEMLSLQLVEQNADCIPERCDGDLVRHLIASHHGYARPFAPVVDDPNPPAVRFDAEHAGQPVLFHLTAEQRAALTPPHRLDAAISQRFWRLTRRYGWWGLAYLEAVLRLADRRASALAATEPAPAQQTPQETTQ